MKKFSNFVDMKRSVLLVLNCLFAFAAHAQSLQGDRILAWQIDMAENQNYDSAFFYGYDACMESVHLFFKWTDLEADTAILNPTFISNFLDIVNIYYPAWDIEVELQIAPTNTGVKEVPSELMDFSFSDPILINRFNTLLDTVFAHIPDVTLSALNIGNESDLNFGTNQAQYDEFKVFLDSVTNHAKELYFNLHGVDLKTGTTLTHHGLTDNATSNLCQSLNDGLDIVAVTYYPLNGDFTMKPPSVVSGDFEALVAQYPDSSQPIYFTECGYASSELCNSSETLQADFWSEVFSAWDTHQDNIEYITVFKSTDWSASAVNELGEYYNLQDTVFKEYLRTLGVRTWNGDGSNKEAYERIRCELYDREWCDVTCSISQLPQLDDQIAVSVYPTPAVNHVTISFDRLLKQPATLWLYTAQGQLVRKVAPSNHSFLIARHGLKSGVYLFQISSANQVYTRGKLIFD